jgi:response regulator RpfG family c-di-GMP phosphodiesterase
MQESILVVDDDEDVLDILKQSLNKNGYDVSIASDPSKALQSYQQKQPNLVILDMMLPGMDGLEVMKQMREAKTDKNTPVLFLSANGDLEIKLNSYDVGAEDYLVKPVSLKELNAKVKRILKNASKTDAFQKQQEVLETEVSKERENYLHINKLLKKQVLAMRTLFNVLQDLTRIHDLEELINTLALTIVGELRISNMIFLASQYEHSESLTVRGVKGLHKEKFDDLEISKNDGFAKWLQGRTKPIKLMRRRDGHWVQQLPDARLEAFEYASPIVIKQELKGIVLTGSKINKGDYSPYDIDMLQFICNSAAFGIESAELFQKLQSTYFSTVRTLVSIIEAKDSYTRGHTERVADYASAVAERMDLPVEEQRKIAFGAVLHDIGKLGVFETVLNKEDELSEEEWEILKAHPEVGAGIIENMEFLNGTVELVMHHHESYDGTGYPSGLKGEEIPVGARIIAVADSFDAMTTDRPYRKALSWDVALSTIQNNSSIQFDPQVVENFIEVLKDRDFRDRMKARPNE